MPKKRNEKRIVFFSVLNSESYQIFYNSLLLHFKNIPTSHEMQQMHVAEEKSVKLFDFGAFKRF